MEKLELKHLAPYLPYKLKVKYWDRIVVMNAGTGSSTHWIGITALLQRQNNVECLPILRPLYDLIREIEHDGEKFVPDFKYDEVFGLNDDYLYEFIQKDGVYYQKDVNNLPYYVFDWLLSLHFDVFGLIEKGLAIDINTL